MSGGSESGWRPLWDPPCVYQIGGQNGHRERESERGVGQPPLTSVYVLCCVVMMSNCLLAQGFCPCNLGYVVIKQPLYLFEI